MTNLLSGKCCRIGLDFKIKQNLSNKCMYAEKSRTVVVSWEFNIRFPCAILLLLFAKMGLNGSVTCCVVTVGVIFNTRAVAWHYFELWANVNN